MEGWKQHEPLAPHTTFQIGGPADHYTEVTSVEELITRVREARVQNLPVTILGGGSNVLISDDGIRGVVIRNTIKGMAYSDTEGTVTANIGAGEQWDAFVADTTTRELWGVENLSGIPGTVGGAVVQNINAYGVTLADLVTEVSAVDIRTGETVTFTPAECEFEYRNSFFKKPGEGKRYAITGVTLQLSKAPVVHTTYRSATQSLEQKLKEKGVIKPASVDVRNEVLSIRSNVGMLEGMYRSAGSFFTNPIISREEFEVVQEKVAEKYKEISGRFEPWHWPVGEEKEKISAAFLMECTPYNKTAFRDQSFNGTVGISPVHTLSVINVGDATADDVKGFVKEITDTVKEEFGIEFKTEVCFL